MDRSLVATPMPAALFQAQVTVHFHGVVHWRTALLLQPMLQAQFRVVQAVAAKPVTVRTARSLAHIAIAAVRCYRGMVAGVPMVVGLAGAHVL